MKAQLSPKSRFCVVFRALRRVVGRAGANALRPFLGCPLGGSPAPGGRARNTPAKFTWSSRPVDCQLMVPTKTILTSI